MKKIMFNDCFGLTAAVLKGQKTMTRRIATTEEIECSNIGWAIEGKERGKRVLCSCNEILAMSRYAKGEIVAIAQAYKDIKKFNTEEYDDVMLDHGSICEAGHPYAHLRRSAGWNNKMFVKADLMPHHIKITDIKVERLQDCSEDDCLKEGIDRFEKEWGCWDKEGCSFYTFSFDSPCEAFAALIDKVSGKGTWDSNPWVFAYEFKLIK